MYNDKFFVPAAKVSIRLNDTISNSINCAAFQPHNDMPTAKYSSKDFSLDMPSIEKSTTPPFAIINSNIAKSKDKLFFIQYISVGTMKEICYLVKVDI